MERVAIIGAGPAGLMAAEVLSETTGSGGEQREITIYDRMPSAGRKFLMAGRGGLNLTHSEPAGPFLGRYREAAERLSTHLSAFDAGAARRWCEGLGIDTFVGSSGRVFPSSMKASPLLRAWLRRLDARGVRLALRHRWIGWNEAGALVFATPQGESEVHPAATILALGGASWKRLGSDGAWAGTLNAAGIATAPFAPANCGAIISWSDRFRDRFAGKPLKRIALELGEEAARGELVISREGLEGGALYQLGPQLRTDLDRQGHAALMLDLKPDVPEDKLAEQLARPRGRQSLANHLRKAARLPPEAIGLVNEAALDMGRRAAELDPRELAALIKHLPLKATATAPLDKAISTAGGIAWDELDDSLMLRRLPGVFAAGEMLDWEAPTGGYLLQACLATGHSAGRSALQWLNRAER